MDASILAVCTSAATVSRGILVYLDRRGDRKLAKHTFDQTRSTDALNGYTRLRKAQQRIISAPRKSSEDKASPPQVSDAPP
jgi:hypothetical protein